MFHDEAELQLDPGGQPVLLVRRWNVWQLASPALGLVQIRRGTTVSTVPRHRVRRIERSMALSLARKLMSRANSLFVQRLTMSRGYDVREAAVVAALMDDYVMIELEDHRGRYEGPAAVQRRHGDEQEPEIRIDERSERTWVAVTVVDEDQLDRPLPRIRFRMRLPDGSTREGALNGQGYTRIDDIEPGKCWVDFTDVWTGHAS